MFEALANAFRVPDLRKKILFTIAIIALYRVGSHIPVPGVSRTMIDALGAATSSSSAPWNLQFRQDNFSLASGPKYTVTFWAKASASRTIGFVMQQMNSPYSLYSNQTASLTTSWQKFSYTFTPGKADTVFLGFNVAGGTGTVWIDGVSMQ